MNVYGTLLYEERFRTSCGSYYYFKEDILAIRGFWVINDSISVGGLCEFSLALLDTKYC